MGNRHLGRKHAYKEHRRNSISKAIWDQPELVAKPTAQEILATPAYAGGMLLNQRLTWNETDKEKLQVLCVAGADVDKSSAALGRDAKSLAYKARDLGIVLPPAWDVLLPKPKYIAHPRQPKILLNYPFFIQVDKDRDADLIAVNKLVPKAIPDHMRGDICQDILLAVYEGKVNLSTLQTRHDLVKQFISHWRKANLERGGYGMMSLDPYGDDKRSWEEQAAAQADWNWHQTNDARGNWEAMSVGFTPATQLDEVYQQQIEEARARLHDQGMNVSFAETEMMLAEGDERVRPGLKRSLVPDRIVVARCVEACGFALTSRQHLNPHYTGPHGQFRSQYIDFTVPKSKLPPLQIRVADHGTKFSQAARFDTNEIGVDGVCRALKLLAGNIREYETIYSRHDDVSQVMREVL